MKTYDAIVVGAGHNGLTTAAFLAKAGLDVVCVEKNDYIGTRTALTCAVFCARKFIGRSSYTSTVSRLRLMAVR
jgi:phytoene dehydrogenase-like protein